MPNDEPPPRDWGLLPIGLMGVTAVLAWLAMLWFMFGDVLTRVDADLHQELPVRVHRSWTP